MKPKPKIGQILYSLGVGTGAKYYGSQLDPVRVISVGPGYFECHSDHFGITRKFQSKTWKTKPEYHPAFMVYESPQAWEDDKNKEERLSTWKRLSALFSLGHPPEWLSVEDLREIEEIVKKKK
jgi:hypothetical protein